jgi:hypothetical protein
MVALTCPAMLSTRKASILGAPGDGDGQFFGCQTMK